MVEYLLDSGANLILALQEWGSGLVPSMQAISFLGTEDFYMLVLPVLFWSVDAALGVRVGVMLLFSAELNSLLKWTFHLPRPFWYEAGVQGLGTGASFGFPSGHSQTPLVIYGLMALAVKRAWAWIAAAVLVFLIGLSRVWLGVHFPIDVLGGWLVGAALLFAYLGLQGPVWAWLKQQRLWAQIGIVFLVAVAMILAGVLVAEASSDFVPPAEWLANAEADQPGVDLGLINVEDLYTSAGVLFGLAAGGLWLYRRGWFDAGGELWKRGARFAVGVFGVVILWKGLGMVFPDQGDLLSHNLRFLRYGLIGAWVSGVAPWLFIRLGWAERPHAVGEGAASS